MKRKMKLLLICSLVVCFSTQAQFLKKKKLNTKDNTDIKAVKTPGFNTTQKDVSPAINRARREPFRKIETGNVYSKSGGYSTKGYRVLQVQGPSSKEFNDTKEHITKTETVGNEVCVTKDLTLSANNASFKDFVLHGTKSWMNPGVFMKASEYLNDNPTIYSTARKPIKLSIDIPTSISSITVDNPHQISGLVESVNFLRNAPNTTVPMNGSWLAEEIHSEQELEFKLHGKYTGTNISAELGLEYSHEKESHYYLLEVTQKMYTITMDNFNMYDIFMDDTNVDYSDLVYVSSVSYGRKGLVVVESDRDLKDFTSDVSGSVKALGKKAELGAELSYMKNVSNFKIKAFLYGGTPDSAFESLDASTENQRLELVNWLKDQPGNPKYGLPISYQLKNLAGETVNFGSSFKQTLRTCSSPIKDQKKLKITLTDLVCIKGRDKKDSNPDDYGFQQAVKFIVNNKEKNATVVDIKKFPNRNCSNALPYSNNKLICGDMNNQIQVEQTGARFGNINNSVTFTISPEELTNTNLDMKMNVYSWLKEYTTGTFGGDQSKVLYNGSIDVAIRDVLTDLLVDPSQIADTFNTDFYDSEIIKPEYGKFKAYGGQGATIWLRQVNGGLDGPISLGTPSSNDGYRGAAWIRFEIVN